MRFKLIMTFVKPELTEMVLKTAKKNGATGDVIVQAKGSGLEPAKFLGISIADKTDIVLMVVEEHIVKKVLNALELDCKLQEPGNGIALVMGIERVGGLDRQIEAIKEKLREENL